MPRLSSVFVHPLRRVSPQDPGVPGHVARTDAVGLSFHCPMCDQVTLHPWAAVDALQVEAASCVRLPPCACGTISFLSVNDEQYGADDPGFATQAAVLELRRARYPSLRVAKVRAPRRT